MKLDNDTIYSLIEKPPIYGRIAQEMKDSASERDFALSIRNYVYFLFFAERRYLSPKLFKLVEPYRGLSLLDVDFDWIARMFIQDEQLMEAYEKDIFFEEFEEIPEPID